MDALAMDRRMRELGYRFLAKIIYGPSVPP